MSLIIDTREPQSEILEVIANLDMDMPEFKFEKIDKGDYLLDNGGEKLLIERKQIGDFCATYRDLKDRFDIMRTNFDETGLIIEGNYITQNKQICLWRGNCLVPSMSEQAFFNFKLSQQKRGSYYEHTNDLAETIRVLIYWHDYLPKAGKNPVRKSKNAIEWFAQLPGVGLLSAFNLRADYESPKWALENIEDWIPSKAKGTLEKW
jgi:ERCC4-type nuclease